MPRLTHTDTRATLAPPSVSEADGYLAEHVPPAAVAAYDSHRPAAFELISALTVQPGATRPACYDNLAASRASRSRYSILSIQSGGQQSAPW